MEIRIDDKPYESFLARLKQHRSNSKRLVIPIPDQIPEILRGLKNGIMVEVLIRIKDSKEVAEAKKEF